MAAEERRVGSEVAGKMERYSYEPQEVVVPRQVPRDHETLSETPWNGANVHIAGGGLEVVEKVEWGSLSVCVLMGE